jgi:hypothetical protein
LALIPAQQARTLRAAGMPDHRLNSHRWQQHSFWRFFRLAIALSGLPSR